jgi:hypothetical protein
MAVRKEYRGIVGAAAKAAGLIGVPGAFSFGLDVTAMTGIWAAMIVALGAKSNHKVDKIFAAKLATGILTGIAAYVTGSKIAMKLLHLVPGAGSIAAMGVNGTLNYVFTYRVGHAISNLFAKGNYDEADMKVLLTTVLSLVGSKATLAEINDMATLGSEAVDSELVTSFQKPELFGTFEDAS